MKKALLLFFASVLLGGGVIRSQGKPSPAGTAAVPGRLLQGDKLVLPNLYCSIASPWKDARWLRRFPDKGRIHSYYCVNDKAHKVLSLVVNTTPNWGFREHEMAVYVRALTAPYLGSGWKTRRIRFRESPVPISGASYSYMCKMTRKGTRPLILRGAVVSGKYLYAIQGTSRSLKPDEDLKSFVRSFHFTSNAPPLPTVFLKSARDITKVNTFLALFMMLLYAAVLFGLPAAWNATSFGRRAPQARRWMALGGALSLFVLHLFIQFILIRRIGPDLTPEMLGQLFGSAVLAFALPLALFLWIEGRRKRKAALLR